MLLTPSSPPLCFHTSSRLFAQVKTQTIKTAIESAQMLLRIDDIVSGLSKKDKGAGPRGGAPEVEDHDNVDSERMLAE